MANIKIPVEVKMELRTKLKTDGTFSQYGGVRMKVSGFIDEEGFLNMTIDVEDTISKKEQTLLKLIEDAKRS